MADSPYPKSGGSPPSDDGDRPTVAPPFDPLELTRRSLSPAGQRAVRRPAITLTDPAELEAARRATLPTLPPAPTAPPVVTHAVTPAAPAVRFASAASSLAALDDALGDLAPPTRSAPNALEAALAAAEKNGDHEHALVLAEQLLSTSPRDAGVRAAVDRARAGLRSACVAALGGLDGVPVVKTARDALAALDLDHRAGFLLSHVDGASSFETILDVSGMPELDALRILAELVRRGVLGLRP